MQHTRLIRAAIDNDSDSGMDEEIDPNEITRLKKSGGRAIGFMPDNGDGNVEIWRIDGKEPIQVEKQNYGIFFGGKSYVVKYQYKNKYEDNGIIIYYWQVILNRKHIFFTNVSKLLS